MKVIITEKPSVARDIAKVLNVNSKKDGYIENQNYQITWAFGHLVELANPVDYNLKYEKWNLSDLPIYPDKFNLKVKNNSGAKKQYKIIKKLFTNATEIICATDAGREGELIFRYIYDLIGVQKPLKRLWISSMTQEAISKGFQNLKNGADYNNLYYAALSRSYSDWLIGINATRAFTLSNHSQTLLSLGRVQTPTLYMIAYRFFINKNFKPVLYYVPTLTITENNTQFTAVFQNKNENINLENKEENTYLTLPESEKIINEIKNKPLVLKTIKDSLKQIKAPNLLDLTTLQQLANTAFGFTASKTLEITQKLYETHKIISYPRTDSRFLTDDMLNTVSNTIQLFTTFNNTIIDETLAIIAQNDLLTIKNKRVFNASKVNDHHALMPIENKKIATIYQSLTPDEKNIFELISEYFLKAFMPNYEYQSVIYDFEITAYLFRSIGNTTVNIGWKKKLFLTEKNKKNTDVNLPKLTKPYQTLNYVAANIDKKTTAPPLLNEASLLKYMENVHTFFKEDKEALSQIKKTGIGTPATRAATIETLKKRKYIEVSKKALIPTKLGSLVVKTLAKNPLLSPITTANMESYLSKIEKGELSLEQSLVNIKKFTTMILKDITENNDTNAFKETTSSSKKTNLSCPKCNSGFLIENQKSFYCSNYKKDDANSCTFSIWKTIASKKINHTIVQELIKTKKTKKIKGFKSKAGKKFEAALILKKDFTIGFEF